MLAPFCRSCQIRHWGQCGDSDSVTKDLPPVSRRVTASKATECSSCEEMKTELAQARREIETLTGQLEAAQATIRMRDETKLTAVTKAPGPNIVTDSSVTETVVSNETPRVCANTKCGKPLEQRKAGRPSKFCSDGCRIAAHRAK